MARQDICFLDNTQDRVEMPLEITGVCSGVATLMQKVTTLMMATTSDPTRNYGGALGDLLGSGNLQNEQVLQNYFQKASVDVFQLLQEEQRLNLHDFPDDEILTGLSVQSVSVLDRDKAAVEFLIENQAGDQNYFNVNIPIINEGV